MPDIRPFPRHTLRPRLTMCAFAAAERSTTHADSMAHFGQTGHVNDARIDRHVLADAVHRLLLRRDDIAARMGLTGSDKP